MSKQRTSKLIRIHFIRVNKHNATLQLQLQLQLLTVRYYTAES